MAIIAPKFKFLKSAKVRPYYSLSTWGIINERRVSWLGAFEFQEQHFLFSNDHKIPLDIYVKNYDDNKSHTSYLINNLNFFHNLHNIYIFFLNGIWAAVWGKKTKHAIKEKKSPIKN